MAQTLIEKIVQNHAVGLDPNHIVQSGDFISIQPRHVMTHDNTGAVMGKFKTIGATKMSSPRQPVFTLDHNVQDTSEANLNKYNNIEKAAGNSVRQYVNLQSGISKEMGKRTFFETQNANKKKLLNKEKEGEIYKNIKKVFSDAELLEVKKKD